MTRLRNLLVGLGLFTGSLVLAILAIEAGVRILHLVPDRFWQPDPLLGARLIPGKRGWWTQEEREFVTPVEINSLGFRDLPRQLQKPEGTYRILVIGDSFVEAMHVPVEETFPRRLEAILRGRDQMGGRWRIEVVAAGVSGWGTASELLWFRHEGHRYAPDLVLLSFYPGNDVKNNSPVLESTLRPYYDESGRIERVIPAKPPRRRRTWSERLKLIAFLRQSLAQPYPGRAAWLTWLGLGPNRVMPNRRSGDGDYPVDYGVYSVPWSTAWWDAWQRTERLLGEFRREVEGHGAQFAVVVIAGREQTDPQSWQRILETYPRMRHVRWDLEAPQRALLEWCEREKVACLPLWDRFRQLRSVEPLHYPYDGHFTPAGHAAAAEAIADFILAKFGVL